MSSFAYINQTYSLNVKRGSRVEYTGGTKGVVERGTVTSANGQYINIRFDGEARPTGPFHPTWEMRYLDSGSP